MKNKDMLFINAPIKLLDKKERRFEGYASTNNIDRVGDVVLPEAFRSTLDTYKKNPIILYNHNKDFPIGAADFLEIRPDRGLYVKGFASQATDVDNIWQKMAEGIIRSFSFSYTIKDSEFKESVQIIKELDLFEISVVSVPANAEALLTVAKSVEAANLEGKTRERFIKLQDQSIIQVWSTLTEEEKKAQVLDQYLEEKRKEAITRSEVEQVNKLETMVKQLRRCSDILNEY